MENTVKKILSDAKVGLAAGEQHATFSGGELFDDLATGVELDEGAIREQDGPGRGGGRERRSAGRRRGGSRPNEEAGDQRGGGE